MNEKEKGGFLIDDRPGRITKKAAKKLAEYLTSQGYEVSFVSDCFHFYVTSGWITL